MRQGASKQNGSKISGMCLRKSKECHFEARCPPYSLNIIFWCSGNLKISPIDLLTQSYFLQASASQILLVFVLVAGGVAQIEWVSWRRSCLAAQGKVWRGLSSGFQSLAFVGYAQGISIGSLRVKDTMDKTAKEILEIAKTKNKTIILVYLLMPVASDLSSKIQWIDIIF